MDYDENEGYELECQECGWQGSSSDLHCSDEDDKSNKPVKEIVFDRCPDCDSQGIEDVE